MIESGHFSFVWYIYARTPCFSTTNGIRVETRSVSLVPYPVAYRANATSPHNKNFMRCVVQQEKIFRKFENFLGFPVLGVMESRLLGSNGFSPKYWGAPLWKALHIISLNIPLRPTKTESNEYYALFKSLCTVLPCRKCRGHFCRLVNRTNSRLSLNKSMFVQRASDPPGTARIRVAGSFMTTFYGRLINDKILSLFLITGARAGSSGWKIRKKKNSLDLTIGDRSLRAIFFVTTVC